MSEARGSPEKKRRHNHESPERGKQQEEIVCGHVRNSPMVCDKVGLSPARVAHIAISDAGIKTGTPATKSSRRRCARRSHLAWFIAARSVT